MLIRLIIGVVLLAGSLAYYLSDRTHERDRGTVVITAYRVYPLAGSAQVEHVMARYPRESWEMTVDTELRVGDSGWLHLKREFAETVEVEITEFGPGAGDTRRELRDVRPQRIAEPVEVSVDGPFEWSGKNPQVTAPGAANPLEWAWVYTAKDPGQRVIQLTLPDGPRDTHVVLDRVMARKGTAPVRVGRFDRIPVNTIGPRSSP